MILPSRCIIVLCTLALRASCLSNTTSPLSRPGLLGAKAQTLVDADHSGKGHRQAMLTRRLSRESAPPRAFNPRGLFPTLPDEQYRKRKSHQHYSFDDSMLESAGIDEDVFNHRFNIVRRFEISWLVIICSWATLSYFFNVYNSSSSSTRGSQAKVAPPVFLQTVMTGENDGEKDTKLQKGYQLTHVGNMLYYAAAATPLIAYTHMAFLTQELYLNTTFSPPLTWGQLAEPFLIVWLISHISFFLLSRYLGSARIFFMVPCTLAEADQVLIEDIRDPAKSTLAPVCIDSHVKARYFEYTCVRYVWNDTTQEFLPHGAETTLTSTRAIDRFKAGGLTFKQHMEKSVAGPNVISIHVPGIFASLVREFLDPIYCFQFACIWVYLFYSAYNIAFVWLVMVSVSGCVKSLLILRQNELHIQELARTEVNVSLLRDGEWTYTTSAHIVPGDIVRVDESVVPCDVVLLEGCAVVNESMLTGEPMPVQRFQVDNNDGRAFSEMSHKKHILFAGTKAMQSIGPVSGRAVGVALSTGARTAKGSLVRMVLFPTAIKFRFVDELQGVYCVMFCYTCTLSSLVLFQDLGSFLVSIFTGLCILCQALNPNMPVSFSIAYAVAAGRMKTDSGINCLSPGRIPVAGKVHVMVMDKTGTITKEGMDFAGVRCTSIGGKAFAAGVTVDVAKLQQEVLWALAACHTVTKLRDGSLVGNMVECEMLRASGWTLGDDSRTLSPPPNTNSEEIAIVKQLEFDHHRMTSGSVIRVGGKQLVLLKGSYEQIATRVKSALPVDFKKVTEKYAADQYYVLGLGYKELPKGGEDWAKRDELEQGLTFAGLILFRNELKPDSPEAINELQQAGIRSIICTGDNALTGAAIGERCGLMGRGAEKPTRMILGDHENGKLCWRDHPSGTEVSNHDVMATGEGEVDLVLTKAAFNYLCKEGQILPLLKRVRVYARMKPHDKVEVIHLHQSQGWVVGMVGDGGNDCGALRAAHVGLALSEAEASVVAPFSSGAEYGTGSKSLMSLVHLVRFGRATLATNIATFCYFMVYGLVLPSSKVYLVFHGNGMLAEWQFLFIDMFLSALMIVFMCLSWPKDKLASIRPTAALVGGRVISNIFLHVGIYVSCFTVTMALLHQQEFYVPYDSLAIGIPPEDWPLRSDSYESAVAFVLLVTQLATAAFSYSCGGEHRKNVLLNWKLTGLFVLNLLGIFFLVGAGPTDVHCTFRVGCDQATSRTMHAKLVSELSVGGVGGCFYGPQLAELRQRMPTLSFPSKQNNCIDLGLNPEEEIQIPSDAIIAAGASMCLGANNCWNYGFRTFMMAMTTFQILFSTVAYQLISIVHPGRSIFFTRL